MHIFFSGAQQADNTFLRRFDNYGKEKAPQHDDCGANMNLSGISRKVQILGSGSMARLCACHEVADDGDVPLLEFPDAFPLVGNCIVYAPGSIGRKSAALAVIKCFSSAYKPYRAY